MIRIETIHSDNGKRHMMEQAFAEHFAKIPHLRRTHLEQDWGHFALQAFSYFTTVFIGRVFLFMTRFNGVGAPKTAHIGLRRNT